MSLTFSGRVKSFKTSKQLYFYDLGTNDFYYVDRNFYDAFQHEPEVDLTQHVAAELADAQSRGMFSNQGPREIRYPIDICELPQALTSCLGSLILEVTQSCNLRCSYCSFSGMYAFNRKHSSRQMSWETAKKALDLYLDSAPVPTIGFFGGEPLLRFDLISHVITYADSATNKQAHYTLTTNGLLLNPAICHFLADHDVSVNISVDGPADVHNRHRKTAMGKATWFQVMRNIRIAKQINNGWFDRAVHLMMLATPPYDLRPFETFVRANRDLIRDPRMIVFSFVNRSDLPTDNPFFIQTNKESELARLRLQYRDALVEGNRADLTIEPSLFDKMMFRIHFRRFTSLPSEPIPPNGSCVPGLRRLFIDSSGAAHVCERINSTLTIGDVDSGLDSIAVKKQMISFTDLTEPECLGCWAARLCAICPAHVAVNGVYSRKKKLDLCHSMKQDLLDSFVLYNEIMERNVRAFDFMDEYFMI